MVPLPENWYCRHIRYSSTVWECLLQQKKPQKNKKARCRHSSYPTNFTEIPFLILWVHTSVGWAVWKSSKSLRVTVSLIPLKPQNTPRWMGRKLIWHTPSDLIPPLVIGTGLHWSAFPSKDGMAQVGTPNCSPHLSGTFLSDQDTVVSKALKRIPGKLWIFEGKKCWHTGHAKRKSVETDFVFLKLACIQYSHG